MDAKGSSMNQARMGLCVVIALLAVPFYAQAQGKPKKPAVGAGKANKGQSPPPIQGATSPPSTESPTTGSDVGTADAAPSTDAAPEDAKGICEVEPSQCPQVDLDAAAKKTIPSPMYAVQQIYALRARRFEINPYWSLTLNDQFVNHPGPGLAINYYLTNVLAIGINFNYYHGINQDSSFNAQARRAARISVPLTEYDYSAALNFTYVPIYKNSCDKNRSKQRSNDTN